MNRLVSAAVSVRDSFWFFAALCTVTAVVLAEVLAVLSKTTTVDDWGLGPVLLQVGAEGSRSLLGAIATAMLGAAATTFSITIAVLALTSSSYGPRLVRNFMADRGNQFVLGFLVATSVYALVVLRHIRVLELGSDNSAFVPHLAVNVAVILAIAGVGCLVYFIHHISVSIQVSTLSTRVREGTQELVEDLYPEDGPPDVGHRATPLVEGPSGVITASTDGYVTGIHEEALLGAARKAGRTLELTCRPGEHRLRGETIALVGPAPEGPGRTAAPSGARDGVDVPDTLIHAVRGAVLLGSSRTPYQDVEFLVSQHVDLVVRALSPGTNDPLTAVNALDDLAAGLAAIAARPGPGNTLLDDERVAWVRLRRVTATELVVFAVDHIRPYVGNHPDVVLQLMDTLARVGALSRSSETRRALVVLLDAVREHAALSEHIDRDRQRIEEQARRVRAGLTAPAWTAADGLGR